MTWSGDQPMSDVYGRMSSSAFIWVKPVLAALQEAGT